MNKKIGIIGCGNMGQAICERLKDNFAVMVYDKDKSKTDKRIGVKISSDVTSLIREADVVILAVKPQDFDSLLLEIEDSVNAKLIVTIAAGIPTNYVEKQLVGAKVVRVMPNMPVKIGKGMSCLCKGKFASEDDLKFVQDLFVRLGQTLILNENMMDEATAISGSGPGFFCDIILHNNINDIDKYAQNILIPSLIATSTNLGFSPSQAKTLASATTSGTIALLKETEISPVNLEKQITSKGGTTEAGLEVLHKKYPLAETVKAVTSALIDTVTAALKRAKELARR